MCFFKKKKKPEPVKFIGQPQSVEKLIDMLYDVFKNRKLTEEEKKDLIERLDKNPVLIHVGDVKLVNKFGEELFGNDTWSKVNAEETDTDSVYSVMYEEAELFRYAVEYGIKKNYAFVTVGERFDPVVTAFTK